MNKLTRGLALAFCGLVLTMAGCEGLTALNADTSLDGTWTINVTVAGQSTTPTYIGSVTIVNGQLDKFLNFPGVPAQFSQFLSIPLNGSTLTIPFVGSLTGTGKLTRNGTSVTVEISVSGSIANQSLTFSGVLNGTAAADGKTITGTATLSGYDIAGIGSGTGSGAPTINFTMAKQ